MAKKRRRQRKRGGGKRRGGGTSPARAGSGVMSGMVGGFRRVVGVEQGPRKSTKRRVFDTVVLVLLVAAAAGLLASRFM